MVSLNVGLIIAEVAAFALALIIFFTAEDESTTKGNANTAMWVAGLAFFAHMVVLMIIYGDVSTLSLGLLASQ